MREDLFCQAKVDAKMAQTLAPSWARPYYRIGRVQVCPLTSLRFFLFVFFYTSLLIDSQQLKKQYEKAIENFNIALAIEPGSKDVKDEKEKWYEKKREEKKQEYNKFDLKHIF